MPDDRLAEYREKRDFTRTPEPPPGDSPPAGHLRFVVHEHHARSLHWDVRLEHGGVLVSWAVPKGVPFDRTARRLAVRTEDHPLAYLTFEGVIPEGEYGAGEVRIWDTGTYDPYKFSPDEVLAEFHGQRLRGRYALVRTEDERWLLRRLDPPEPASWEPMPRGLRPMLATLGPLPDDSEDWAFEVKWDGVRALAFLEGGRLDLLSRRGNEVTAQFPEVRPIAEAYPDMPLVLDGELVAFDDEGHPSFERLQSRLGVSDRRARALAETTPVVYVVFDLLYLDGRTTIALPYRERRRLLEALELEGPNWRVPRTFVGDATAVFDAVRAEGLEGLVCKRLESPYEPGRRSPHWRKVKARTSQEFVVVGWTPRKGEGFGSIGALLLGYYHPPSAPPEERRLVFAGRVGSGLSEADARKLARLLAPLAADVPSVVAPDAPPEARWVRPELVVEVAFAAWTEAERLRSPVFRGLRPDADPREVVRETPAS